MRPFTILLLALSLSACQAAPPTATPTAAEPAAAEPAAATGSGSGAPAQPASAPSAHNGHTEPAENAGPERQPPLADGATGHYGAPFTVTTEPIPLESALASCADTGTACKVSGRIERVCQARGCWFTLAAETVQPTVRVRMLNYGFLVPRNVSGASAIIEGTLVRTQIPQEVAQHYADDEAAAGTAPARTVTGPEDAYEFTITGAEITRM